MNERTERAWAQRCPACRERWPNEAIEAEDGRAGAQARVYNRLCATIFSVKTDGGYDADRDCLVIFVCGPYGRWSEPDAVWDREIEYYVNLSRNMTRVANVQFCIREEAARQDGTRMRVAELSQALKEKGKGHDIFLYFHIGDRRTTCRNWPTRHQILFPWLPTPAMSQTFEDAPGMLQAGSTHAAMKAEYMWNRKPVGGYSVTPRTRSEWGCVYVSLHSASKLPPEVFGEGRFFDRVYRNLYGEMAGRHIANGLRPTTFHGGTLSPEPSHAWLAKIHKVWAFTDSPELQHKWSQLFARIADANRGAMEGIRLALACEDLVRGKCDRLETLREQYGRGLYWAELAQKEADSYATWLNDGKEAGRRSLDAVAALVAPTPEAEAAFAAKVKERIEKAGSELESVRNAVALFEKKLESLRQTAPKIQERIRKELRAREDYDLEQKRKVLGYVRIGLIGHHFRHLMEDENLGYCERLKGLTDEIMNYDVICYSSTKKLTPEGNALIRNFISAGRGFLVAGGTPFYATASVDLTPIADWLGASRYANLAGKLCAELPCFLTQGQEGWLSQFESSKGAACLGTPVTGLPILTYQARRDLSFLMANKYGGGRVVYSTIAKLPQALTHRILLWLGYNKI